MKLNFQDKRGMTLGDIYPAVLTIVMIGLVLGIGIYILAEVRTNVATSYTGSDNNVNLTATTATNTTTLTDSTKDDYSLSSIIVINTTGTPYTVPTSTYSFTSAGVITWDQSLTSVAEYFVNISSVYTHDAIGSPEEAINDTVTGLAGFADWIAIIVVVLAAAIVLGIVLSSFGRRTGV